MGTVDNNKFRIGQTVRYTAEGPDAPTWTVTGLDYASVTMSGPGPMESMQLARMSALTIVSEPKQAAAPAVNGDRRSVATDALETLGNIIDDTAKRDAIHIAVIPAIADRDLHPGDHVSVKSDGLARWVPEGKGQGIVDPFLPEGPKAGERFWLLIYPRKIKSLRHVWSHPEFPDEPGVSVEPAKVDAVAGDRAAAEAWLRRFCDHADCPSFETVMEILDKGTLPSPDSEYYRTGGYVDGEYLHFNGEDAHGDIPPEFWDYAEIYLGKKLTKRPSYFSCSC